MLKAKFKLLAITLLVALQGVVGAAEKEQEISTASKVFLYLPDRVADLLDVVNLGIAVGPSIGAEIALTQYAQLGAYVADEQGIAWMGRNNPSKHAGEYSTNILGPESSREEMDVEKTHRFYRGEWQVRAQVAAGIVHGYVALDLEEFTDFLAGWIGFDPMKDNIRRGEKQVSKKYDTILGTSPLQRLGRGASNLLLGVWEIPKNMVDVSEDRGPAAGTTYGLFRGVGRFVVREVIGVYEIITFPKGGRAIIIPEYPFEGTEDTSWEFNWNE